MKIKAHAKLNFYLEILGKRPDGFHNLRSIMQQIRLHDVLAFHQSNQDQFISRNRPMKQNNLVVRAAQQLKQAIDFPPVRVELNKQIPVGAGLGGGSSDAAATIVGLNRFFSLGLSNHDLKQIGSSLGSDVPFFIDSRAALVEGTGVDITPVSPIDVPHILLARPKGKISTVDVYRTLQPSDYGCTGEFDLFTKSWNNGILGPCFNHLEAPAFRLDSRVSHLKEQMQQTKPLDCIMTGSGNVVFAVYRSRTELEAARQEISRYAQWIRATSTIKEYNDKSNS